VTWRENEAKHPLFEPNNLFAMVFKFLFIIMSLKMSPPPPLCLSASLGMLQPLWYCCMHCLKADICRSLHEGFFQALQVVVTLSAHHVLQNSPQFIVQEVEV
jgi:hypothetical protein